MPVNDTPKTGKGFFFKRLAERFRSMGIEIVTTPSEEHDIYLDTGTFNFKSKKPKVLRLNGVYHNRAVKYKKMNQEIAEHVHKAQGVIYQSEFSRDMHKKFVASPKHWTIIGNGAPLERTCGTARHATKNTFVACARWRPHKRLDDIINSFLLANIEKSSLHVFGDTGRESIYENVHFHGRCSQEVMGGYLKEAKALLHLCWLDWAANSVVEALTLGCPVITNNTGGTCEMIADGCGASLLIDKIYNMETVFLYKPPSIDLYKVAKAMRNSLKWGRVTNNAHVDIKNIATKYAEFLNDCCIRSREEPAQVQEPALP